MEALTLSKRGYTVFKRFIDVKFDKALDIAKNAEGISDDDGIVHHIFNKLWKIELNYNIAMHEDECPKGDGEFMSYGEKCDACNHDELEFIISISYYNGVKDGWKYLEDKSISAEHVTKDKLFAWLNWVEETKNAWKFCPCGAKATMNEVCDTCYIHSYYRTEEEGGDCCICHENNGRWIKQECGHILHTHCWRKIKTESNYGRKCPLCRQVSKYNVLDTQDCYDV